MPVDHYENFPVASLLLPARLRRPVEVIYRFARSADDFADEGDAPPQERLAALAGYREELERIGGRKHARNSRGPACAWKEADLHLLQAEPCPRVLGGGAMMALFGSGDTLSSGTQHVVTLTRALVSPTGLIQGASGAQTAIGNVRLRFTATPTGVGAGHQLFLGIGPASAVDRYLRGDSYAVATDVSVRPFNLTLERHRGTATPPPPGSQSFWVAQASGTHPALTWTVTSGSYRVVVMNTDAAAPVNFTGSLDLTIPHSFGIGIGLLIGGIVVLVLGIALIVLGARTRPQSRPVPDPAAGR